MLQKCSRSVEECSAVPKDPFAISFQSTIGLVNNQVIHEYSSNASDAAVNGALPLPWLISECFGAIAGGISPR